jgi:hypothetical protein
MSGGDAESSGKFRSNASQQSQSNRQAKTQIRHPNKQPGAHAIDLAVSVPALREQGARLGGTRNIEGSFPHTDAGNSARRRMFLAALTSRSCDSPQSQHTQRLTCNPLTP